MDLIDLHQQPDDDFKYILHVRDHFSRYSWAKPLTSKESIVIAGVLHEIFCQFGPPIILQSDNGKEFTANIIRNLVEMWPGLKLINGRPRHPQSQELVERGNSILEKKIGTWMEQNNSRNWTVCLNYVIFVMNNTICRATNKTPYELVFGMHPYNDNALMEHLFENKTCIDEEEILENISIEQEDISHDFDKVSVMNLNI
jgi:transposase InsO family protein